MKKNIPGIVPAATAVLFILVYGVSLPNRPLTAPAEYDFAAFLMQFFPEISGRVMPKLPALAATGVCAALIWLTAWQLRLFHTWMPVVIYLLIPAVWYYGTAASAVQLCAMSVTWAAAMLFFARKTSLAVWKGALCLLAVIPALMAAVLLKYHLFSTAGAVMSLMPILSLCAGAYLERADDRGKGAKYFDRFIRLLVLISLAGLTLLVVPGIFRYFKWHYPEQLVFFAPGASVMRPALVCIVPLLWYFMAKRESRIRGKMLYCAAGIGFVLFALPPVIPWQKFLHNIPEQAFTTLAPELKRGAPGYFADSDSAGIVAYELRVPVMRFGRNDGEMRPLELRRNLEKALTSGDAVVVLSDREFDSYLPPEERGIVYTSGTERRIIRYFGGKK